MSYFFSEISSWVFLIKWERVIPPSPQPSVADAYVDSLIKTLIKIHLIFQSEHEQNADIALNWAFKLGFFLRDHFTVGFSKRKSLFAVEFSHCKNFFALPLYHAKN